LAPLTYAQDIFREIAEQAKSLNLTVEDSLETDIINFAKNSYKKRKDDHPGIEIEDDFVHPLGSTDPIVTKKYFCLYMQERLKILFKDSSILAKLLGDIECPTKKNSINVRELRDQILGYRYSNGNVCTWGFDSNGRLGRPVKLEENKEEEENFGTPPYEPSKVIFPLINGKRAVIIKVSCGNSNTLALASTGEVFSWGLGQRGCLGLGNVPEVSDPVQIKTTIDGTPLQSIKEIACGASHCLAISYYDVIYSWGCGISGRLGHGNEEHYNMPKAINSLPPNLKFIKLSAGDTHSAGITKDLELYTWGDGAYGKLGHGGVANEYTPKHVEELALMKVADVSCGVYHTITSMQNGKVYSFGGGSEGKLGLDVLLEDDVFAPGKIIALDDACIVEICAGPYHSLAINDDGHGFAWGNNRDGRLGVRSMKEVIMLPEPIPDNLFLASTRSNTIKKQEENAYKEYDQLMRKIPKQGLSNDEEIILASCGEDFSAFLSSSGHLYVCGNAQDGRIGKKPTSGEEENKENENAPEEKGEDGKETAKQENNGKEESGSEDSENEEGMKPISEDRLEQVEPSVLHLEGIKFTYVSCGRYHTMAITGEGAVFCWGRNKEGQLGLLGGGNVMTPMPLTFMEGITCTMVACGDTHSLLLTAHGDVFSCGQDENGKLGHTLMMPGEKINELKCEFQPRRIAVFLNKTAFLNRD